MFNTSFSRDQLGWTSLKLDTGKIARQAGAPVLAPMARPSCLPPLSPARSPREGVDFLPLTVDYQGRKTLRRGPHSRPAISSAKAVRPEKETLVSRLIDRPIRPAVVDGGAMKPR